MKTAILTPLQQELTILVAELEQLGSKVMIIQGDPNAQNFYLKVGGKLIGEKESASIPGRYLPVFIINLTKIDN